jgi:hypothetical protein
MGCQEDGAIVTDLLERVADRPDASITTTKPASARVNQQKRPQALRLTRRNVIPLAPNGPLNVR